MPGRPNCEECGLHSVLWESTICCGMSTAFATAISRFLDQVLMIELHAGHRMSLSSGWNVTPACTTSNDGRIELAVRNTLAGGLISVCSRRTD